MWHTSIHSAGGDQKGKLLNCRFYTRRYGAWYKMRFNRNLLLSWSFMSDGIWEKRIFEAICPTFLVYAAFFMLFKPTFLKLWAIAIRVNSVFTFCKPRRWKRRKLILCFMSPKQLSISMLRRFLSACPGSLFKFCLACCLYFSSFSFMIIVRLAPFSDLQHCL